MQFDVLLHTMASQRALRELVGQITHLPEQELLDSLIREFEQVCERYKSLSDFAREASQPLHIDPISICIPDVEFRFPTLSQPEAQPAADEDTLRRQLVDIERMIEDEVRRDWDTRAGEIRERMTRLKTSQFVLQRQLEAIERTSTATSGEAAAEENHAIASPTYDIRDDDRVYLYGVALGGGESISSRNEQGVGEPMLEYSHGGVRVIFSVVAYDRFPMTTTGTLLLGKDESFKLRSQHEAALIALQSQERILAFPWGTLVNGKPDLLVHIAQQGSAWKERLERESRARRVDLRVYASDGAIGKTVGHSGAGKMSVKLLEKILKREHALADGVHDALRSIANASSVHSIVGVNGTFADGWKQILDSSYDVAEERRDVFFSTLMRLQREHNHGQLMLEVVEEGGRLTLAELVQEISA